MNQANPLIENPEVIMNLAWIALAGLGITALSVTIILTVAFRKSENPASLFYELVKRADVLKMLTVFLVLLSVTVLAFFRVIDSSGAVGIFGGVLGYVLGWA